MATTTTYREHYKQKSISYVKPIKATYEEFDALPDGANFLATKINIKSDLGVALEKIQEMYKQRNRSVYMIDYIWKTRTAAHENEDPEEEEEEKKHVDDKDELLQTCEQIKLNKQEDPILPPLRGARIINGYMNPKYFHMGNTTYEEEIGVNACNWMFGRDLKKNRGFLEKDRKKSGQLKTTANKARGPRSSSGQQENFDDECTCSECKNNGL